MSHNVDVALAMADHVIVLEVVDVTPCCPTWRLLMACLVIVVLFVAHRVIGPGVC